MKYFRRETFGGLIFDSQNFSLNFTSDSVCPPGVSEVKGCTATDAKILSAPVGVYFELTRRCNLHCRQCFASCRSHDENELKTAEVLQILQQLQAAGVINVRFTGGEPSQRSDLPVILKAARNLRLVVSLQTNGVYADPESYVAELADIGCDQITVSIDGLAEVHDGLRGKGAFAAVTRTLQAFAARGVSIRLNLLAHRGSIRQLPEIFAFAAENSSGLNIFHMRPFGRASVLKELLPDADDSAFLAEQVSRLSQQYPQLSVVCSALGSQRRPAPIDLPVPAGFTALCIAADGSVWPHHYSCYIDSGHRLGHLPADDLATIWSVSPVLNDFRNMVQKHFSYCDKCTRHGKTCYGFDFEALIIEDGLKRQSGICSNFREL